MPKAIIVGLAIGLISIAFFPEGIHSFRWWFNVVGLSLLYSQITWEGK